MLSHFMSLLNPTHGVHTPAPPAAAMPARRSLCITHFHVPQVVRDKLVAHHSDMIRPDAETTTIDRDGHEVTRTLTPRETMRHMKEIHFFTKLNLGQQKLDARIADQDDEEEISLNQYVNYSVLIAGERLQKEALDQGLSCIAELPNKRVFEVYEEEKQKYDAAHPAQRERGRTPPFAIPEEERNDWFIPVETQILVMQRLVDMATPEGKEYPRLSVRDRQMASRLIGQFHLLQQEQHLINMRIHNKKPDVDLEQICAYLEKAIPEELEFRRNDLKEFYKTHEPGGRGWPPRAKTDVGR
jgi:hypothetical protein